MDVRWVPIKIKERLNKLASGDYDNIHCWQFVEAYNKAQIEYVRNSLRGLNLTQEGAEESITMIDDYQRLLETKPLKGVNKPNYFESLEIPKDYLRFNRVVAKASNSLCTGKRMRVSIIEEANFDPYFDNENRNPSFSWASTFATFKGNSLYIYTDGDFKIKDVQLVYFRKPVEISLAGCRTLEDEFTTNVDPEFKDDLVEIIIDKAAEILASDIESINQAQLLQARAAKNT
jgi:hypothetical protein